MSVYYNEIDAYAAQWQRNLMSAGVIAQGHVDMRSIMDVTAKDLARYRQCHFFSGIGTWSYALRLAGWPDDEPAWTGSCPCQPFSVAGKHQRHTDERHLWPEFFRLIKECRPAIIFGEQTAGAAGRAWLTGVRADLATIGYACGAADLCAASVGSPTIRQRLYWMAIAESARGRTAHAMGNGSDQESRGSSSELCSAAWPDHGGRTSSLTISDVLLPIDGDPNYMAKMRAIGNAIVPQVAAEFIKAAREAIE